MDIFQTLKGLDIQYELHEHEPVFTCEQAERVTGHLAGLPTKNLFVRDRKGKRHFLIVVSDKKSVDLNSLSELLECSRLSMGSPERLMKHLGIEPGSVSILALINDKDNAVELILDEEVAHAKSLQAHPLTNAATLIIPRECINSFMAHTGHTPHVISVPGIN